MYKTILTLILAPCICFASNESITKEDLNNLTKAINELSAAIKEHKKILEKSSFFQNSSTQNETWPHKESIHWLQD